MMNNGHDRYDFNEFIIPLNEIDQPLDYFMEKFRAEHYRLVEKQFKEIAQNRLKYEKETEQREIEQLKALLKKYGNNLD